MIPTMNKQDQKITSQGTNMNEAVSLLKNR